MGSGIFLLSYFKVYITFFIYLPPKKWQKFDVIQIMSQTCETVYRSSSRPLKNEGFWSKERKVAGTTSSSKWRNKENICHGEKAKVFRLKNKRVNQGPEGKVRLWRMIQSKKRNGIRDSIGCLDGSTGNWIRSFKRENIQLSVDCTKGRRWSHFPLIGPICTMFYHLMRCHPYYDTEFRWFLKGVENLLST